MHHKIDYRSADSKNVGWVVAGHHPWCFPIETDGVVRWGAWTTMNFCDNNILLDVQLQSRIHRHHSLMLYRSGASTVECCAHIASVLQYLGYVKPLVVVLLIFHKCSKDKYRHLQFYIFSSIYIINYIIKPVFLISKIPQSFSSLYWIWPF